MQNLVALGLMVSDKKIFKEFHFVFKEQEFLKESILSRNSKEDHGRIISAKFHQNLKSSCTEDV